MGLGSGTIWGVQTETKASMALPSQDFLRHATESGWDSKSHLGVGDWKDFK